MVTDPENCISIGVGNGLFAEKLGIKKGIESSQGMAELVIQTLTRHPKYANIAYSNYLLAVSSQNTFAEGLAALIPCYWIYLKMAEHHSAQLKANQNEIYKDWASVFKRKEFRKLVEDSIILLEAELTEENFELLKNQFNNSIKFEYYFFDDVYHKNLWKI